MSSPPFLLSRCEKERNRMLDSGTSLFFSHSVCSPVNCILFPARTLPSVSRYVVRSNIGRFRRRGDCDSSPAAGRLHGGRRGDGVQPPSFYSLPTFFPSCDTAARVSHQLAVQVNGIFYFVGGVLNSSFPAASYGYTHDIFPIDLR